MGWGALIIPTQHLSSFTATTSTTCWDYFYEKGHKNGNGNIQDYSVTASTVTKELPAKKMKAPVTSFFLKIRK